MSLILSSRKDSSNTGSVARSLSLWPDVSTYLCEQQSEWSLSNFLSPIVNLSRGCVPRLKIEHYLRGQNQFVASLKFFLSVGFKGSNVDIFRLLAASPDYDFI